MCSHDVPGIFLWILDIVAGVKNLKYRPVLFNVEKAIHEDIPWAHNYDPVSFLVEQRQVRAILFHAMDVRDQGIVPLPVVGVPVGPHYREGVKVIFLLSPDHFEAFGRNPLLLNETLARISFVPAVGLKSFFEHLQKF